MAHNKLYRNFIILQEDERGYSHSNDKALSGYAKVEAKGDKCKVSFYAQNLRPEENYSMVLICCKRDLKQLIDLGSLPINEVGKGDTSKEYYVNNIAGLGISYEKISGAAICRIKDNQTEYIMHGFMNGEDSTDNWRKFKMVKVDSKKYINKLDSEPKNKDSLVSDIAEKDISLKSNNNVESKFVKTSKSENVIVERKTDDNSLKSKGNIKVEVLKDNDYKSDIANTKDIEAQSNVAKILKSETILTERKKDENSFQSKTVIESGLFSESNFNVEDKQSNRIPEKNKNITETITTLEDDRNKCKEMKKCDKSETIEEALDKLAKKLDTYDGVIDLRINNIHDDIIVYGFIMDRKNNNCKWKKFKVENKCRKESQDFNNVQGYSKRIEENFKLDKLNQIDKADRIDRLDIIDFDEYENDIQKTGLSNMQKLELGSMQQPSSSNNMQQPPLNNNMQEPTSNKGFKVTGEVGQYFEKLAEKFEPYNGSLTDINYCKLYKINVNSMEDLSDESNYNQYTLAYYPMLNYYPYISKAGHFLLGYKCNRNGEMQYIVYCIPGSKEKNDQPYGGRTGFVTWTSDNKNGRGYWLMFYDFKNSSIVVPTK